MRNVFLTAKPRLITFPYKPRLTNRVADTTTRRMNTSNLYRSLVAWQNAVKLCEELAKQTQREILVLQGDKRTREGREAKARQQVSQQERDRWDSLVDELHT